MYLTAPGLTWGEQDLLVGARELFVVTGEI